MKLDDLTLGQIKQLRSFFLSEEYIEASPWVLGEVYLIRTVTMIDTGRLVAITKNELVLEDAAWIADTGRFSDALKSVDFDEIEPFPDGRVIIGRGSIIDAVSISSVQRSQK